MYDGILWKLQLNLDERQLELQRNQYEFGNTNCRKIGRRSAVFIKIALKWNALDLGLKDTESMTECICIQSGDMRECRSLQRLHFVMELFEEYFLKQLMTSNDSKIESEDEINYIDIVMQCLSNYNGIAMIDDLEHIRGRNKADLDLIDCPFADIDGGECISEMMKKYRNSERRENDEEKESDDLPVGFKQFMIGLDLRERNIMETSTKIHSLLCHNGRDLNKSDGDDDDAMGYPDPPELLKGRTVELKSKFVNEVQSEKISENMKNRRMEELGESLKANGLSVAQCNRFERALIAECYDSEAIINDLVDIYGDPFNLYSESNLFPMIGGDLFLAKAIKRHFNSKQNDDDEVSSFWFGKERLYHSECFKDRPGYVSAKYGSLKEECLQNRIYPMKLKQFATFMFDAFMFRKSRKGRSAKANDMSRNNLDYEVPAHSPLSVCHIFVVLMYCNDTKLQYLYKKMGCREHDDDQSIEELKGWNREIAHWHRLLVEVVYIYGDLVSPKQKFFTGLNIKLSFQSFAPRFNAPFSTTVSFDVALKFCGGDGVILQLRGSPECKDQYFDVEWMSDFDQEKERLFVFAENLVIGDILYFHCDTLLRNGHYLKAFQLFSALFEGHFISPLIRGFKGKKQHKPWRVLLDLITIYKATNGITKTMDSALKIRIPLYVQQLFYQLLDGFKRNKGMKYVIESEIDLLDETLKREFVLFPPSVSGDEKSHQLTLESQLTLSPFMQTLCSIDNIALMQKYIWIIDGMQFNEVKNAISTKRIFSETYYFNKPDVGKVSFAFDLQRKSGGTSSAAIGIGINATDIPVDIRWSVMVEEVGYNRNDIRFNRMVTKKYQGKFAFDDHYFNEVEMLTVTIALYLNPSQ